MEARIAAPSLEPTRTHLRRAVQALSLVAFAVLSVAGLRATYQWIPEELFSRLDPLVGLAAVLASRTLAAFWAIALITVAFTLLFGRAWCGWICPMGTLLDVVPAAGRKRARWRSPAWRLGKYVTLITILGGAVFGTLSPMVLDPVTVVSRPLQEILRPFVGTDGVGANAGAYIARYAFRPLALLSLLPLAAVLALNALGRRTWCRSLCPLGGLLGVLSRAPGIRRRVDAEACTSCARCAAACPTSAIDREDAFASNPSECTVCLLCEDACPQDAISFRPSVQPLIPSGYEPDRRETFTTLGATAASLAVVALPFRTQGEILRPPSTDEERLAELCVRCGACYSACPTGSLRPSLAITSPAGLWTPMLDERPAHCTLSCNLCAAVCPTDAIHKLDFWEEIELDIVGVAQVDKRRCRAWGAGKSCMACRGGCPIRGALVQVEAPSRYGNGTVGAPEVNIDLCIGCNQCAAACVVTPAAIGVVRDSESYGR